MRQKVDKEKHMCYSLIREHQSMVKKGREGTRRSIGRTRGNMEKCRKDSEVSEGQWRSVRRTVEKCRKDSGEVSEGQWRSAGERGELTWR